MLRRLARDRRGVSAVEFALIAPVMVTLYLGLAELTMGLMADRRANHVASAVGDLVAQVSSTSASEVADIFAVGGKVMQPYPTGSLNMRVSSVKADTNGVPKVVWSRAQGASLTAYAKNATVTLPANLIAADESVIMSEVRYTYTSPLAQTLPTPLVFNDVYYLRPRRAEQVICATC